MSSVKNKRALPFLLDIVKKSVKKNIRLRKIKTETSSVKK
jgi:hypothetical protein